MLAEGADDGVRTEDGRTLLHLAARYNENADVLDFLLENGDDLKARDDDGELRCTRPPGTARASRSSRLCWLPEPTLLDWTRRAKWLCTKRLPETHGRLSKRC